MNTSDWQEVMDRLDKIEKSLEKVESLIGIRPHPWKGGDCLIPKGQPCMWDNIPLVDRMQPVMSLSCPCPKCTPQC